MQSECLWHGAREKRIGRCDPVSVESLPLAPEGAGTRNISGPTYAVRLYKTKVRFRYGVIFVNPSQVVTLVESGLSGEVVNAAVATGAKQPPPTFHHRPPRWKQPGETCTATQGMHAQLYLSGVIHLAQCSAILNPLIVSNKAFCSTFHFRLGLSPRPMHAPRLRCGCGALVDPPPGSPEPGSFQHAEKCPHVAAAQSARHNIFCGSWCQVVQSAGVPTSLEPNCSRFAVSNPVTAAGGGHTGRTSCVSSRTASCSPMCPSHTAVLIHTWRRQPPLQAPLQRHVQRRRWPSMHCARPAAMTSPPSWSSLVAANAPPRIHCCWQ